MSKIGVIGGGKGRLTHFIISKFFNLLEKG